MIPTRLAQCIAFATAERCRAASINSSMLIASTDARVERMLHRSVGRIGGT
jgi:hypothetical protein